MFDNEEPTEVTCAYCLKDVNPEWMNAYDYVRLTCEGVCPACHDAAEAKTAH